jgi:hypothetical protein
MQFVFSFFQKVNSECIIQFEMKIKSVKYKKNNKMK